MAILTNGKMFSGWVYLFSLILGVVLPSCGKTQSPENGTDTYTITIEKENPRLISIEADLTYASNILSMEWASAQFLSQGWATFVTDLKVYNSTGEKLAIEPILPAKWKINGKGTERIHLSYKIRLTHDLVVWEEGGHSEAAYVLESLIFFIGRAVFISSGVLPEEFDDRKFKIIFNVPENFTITSQWEKHGGQNSFRVNSTRELVNSGILVGQQTVRKFKIDNINIIIATGNDFSAAIPLFESIYQAFAPFANRVMGGSPATNYVVMANMAPRNEKFGPYFSGGVLSRTISLIAPAVPGPEMEPIIAYILSHEYLHLWNTHGPVAEEQLESWFTEGFTDYMAIRILHALGQLPDEEFLNGERGILGNYQKYLNGRDPNVSLRNAGLTKNQGSYDFVYSGGFTFAAALDMELLNLTKGKSNLADYVRQVFTQFSGKKKISLGDLIEVANEMAGENFHKMFENYVLGTQILPLGDYLLEVGLKMDNPNSVNGKIYKIKNIDREKALLQDRYINPRLQPEADG